MIQRFLKELFHSVLTFKLVFAIGIVLFVSLLIPVAFTILAIHSVLESMEPSTPSLFGIYKQVGVVAVVLFLFAVLSSFLLVEPVMNPLRKIIENIQRILEGKEEKNLVVKSGDELQKLAELLSEMTSRFRETIKREKEVSRMKSEFLALAAHQLRTPLSELKWAFYTALAGEMGNMSKELRMLLEKSSGSNERMIALVNSILYVVQIEEGRFNFDFQKHSLVNIVEKTVEEMQFLAEQKSVALHFGKPSASLPPVLLDVEKFRLALSNIVENAIQYTKEGGNVEVSILQEEESLVVNVKDTGIGILEQELPRLFTKFFRGTHAVKMKTDGTGLGLFIAKNIVERHGGQIRVESREGEGSTFSVVLPIPPKFREPEKTYQKFMEEF